MRAEAEGEELQLGSVVEALEGRGFGPILLAPALLALLPTGGIPGVPTTAGIIIFLVAIQMVFGKTSPWLPKRLREFSFSRDRFNSMLDKVLPVTRKLDAWFHTRLETLTRSPFNRVLALCCALLGLSMIPLELLPFAAAIPAAAIVLIALGLSTRDGVLILLAFAVLLVGAGVLLSV
ncbi:MAG: exopolysaccharide biosynthesis protein [Thiolinea sp.]